MTGEDIAREAKQWGEDLRKTREFEKIAKSMNNDVVDVFGLKITRSALKQAGFLKDGEFDYQKYNDGY